MSSFDGDNKKTCCSASVDRTKGEDRPLAIDISHESVSAAQHRSNQSTQQQHNNCHRKQQQQAGQVEEEGERGQEGRKEEEKESKEEGREQVEKNTMDWTVVTRSKGRRRS